MLASPLTSRSPVPLPRPRRAGQPVNEQMSFRNPVVLADDLRVSMNSHVQLYKGSAGAFELRMGTDGDIPPRTALRLNIFVQQTLEIRVF